ncbi:MAG: PQQ-binding-like beta-propeller repeat protein [Muribaculaceae bacterium]|nr:PQQ-binding-like beta-propeller repeat protein [Muribaculaceae bacterium]MBR0023999.1 PQQ-binding-like beta-propeller repeat protein [Muribaculaceae bacterium]
MIKNTSFFKILLVVALLLVVNTGMAQIVATQKLAILSDIHVTPGNANEGKLKEAVAEINGTDVDAVIVSGDLTNEGSDVQLRNVKSILDGITKPLYVIPGNHENNWSQSACKTFNDLWGNDRFVFTVGKLVVIGMNCGPFMKMGDGHIKQEDLTWLDKTLSEMVKPGMKVLSINHYPLLDDLDNYRDYAYILKKYPVITHVNGHWHRWRQYETDGIVGLMVRCLDMGDGDYGYTLMDVDLDHDWIHVYNKTLGKERDIRYAYKINQEYYSIDTRKIQYSVPQDFKVEKVYADNASIFTRLGIDKDNIYFGNSMGYLRVIDKKKAKLKWEYKTTSMLFSRPAVADKVVILPTGDKRLIWLDKKNGKVLNEVAAEGPYVADGVIADGVLYQGGFKTFQAWNVNTMKLLWEYTDINNYCQAEPFVGQNDIIFGAWDTNLRSLDCKSGALNWSWNNGKKTNLYSPGNVVPAVTEDRVVIVAPDRNSTALDRATGKQLWRHHDNAVKVRESLGLSEDGKRAYAKTMDGTIVAMDTESDDYHQLWDTDCGFGYEHAPCIVLEHNGYIYAGSRRGMLAVLDAATGKLVFRYEMGSSEVNGFEVDPATGDIYCSLIEGTIWRISHK